SLKYVNQYATSSSLVTLPPLPLYARYQFDSAPVPEASALSANGSATVDYSNLSTDDLKRALSAAETLANERNRSVAEAETKLADFRTAAIEPNRLFEEAKKSWEE
ncbi:hypothetical protein PFISCL1PPCAC_8610, partial [Pristionchus fissidentatus]